MSQLNVTYSDVITHANSLRIKFIPWNCCKCGSKLGSGASMNVFEGTYEDNGVIHKAAFKSVKASLTEKTRETKRSLILRDIRQEIRIMGCLKGHSRIVQLLAVSFNEHTPILILELAKSNLEDYLQKETAEWKTKLGFMFDIALGLEAIHKVEAVHGDLKAANILIYDGNNNQVTAKISDFGYSSTDLSVQAGRTPGFTTLFRSLESFDPELSDWNGKHTTDIYSYGLVVYQIADNGTVPFDDYGEEEVNIMKKEGSEIAVLMKNLPEDTPIEVRKIIKATVKNVPSERSGLDEVKNTLEECTQLSKVYSYEEAKIAFESFAQAGPQESLDIVEMNKLPIPLSLRASIFSEYQRLADTGDKAAVFNLGKCWHLGFGTKVDIDEAAKCYEISAEAGNADAQNSFGWCCEQGLGVLKDYAKAVKWYTKGAEAGNTNAQNQLAWLYQHGEGVAQDYKKAVELYTKAIEAGNSMAQSNLGLCYEKGYGVDENHIEAVRLYVKAIEAGNIYAPYHLGRCYENGIGVDENYVKAVQFYTKTVEVGNIYGMYDLARCYMEGKGVAQKDRDKAIELYTKAAEGGHKFAREKLESIKNSKTVI